MQNYKSDIVKYISFFHGKIFPVDLILILKIWFTRRQLKQGINQEFCTFEAVRKHFLPFKYSEFFSFLPTKVVKIYSNMCISSLSYGLALLNCFGYLWNMLVLSRLTQSALSLFSKCPSLSQDLAYQCRIRSFNTAYNCKDPFHSPFQLDSWTSHTAPRRWGVWCPCVVAGAQLNVWRWQRPAQSRCTMEMCATAYVGHMWGYTSEDFTYMCWRLDEWLCFTV